MAYRSAAHPDVRSGRRAEDDVLREFLATFDGPLVADAAGGVDAGGWAEYYACVSFFEPSDAAFGVLLYETWGLARLERFHGAPPAPHAAGPRTQYEPPPAMAPVARGAPPYSAHTHGSRRASAQGGGVVGGGRFTASGETGPAGLGPVHPGGGFWNVASEVEAEDAGYGLPAMRRELRGDARGDPAAAPPPPPAVAVSDTGRRGVAGPVTDLWRGLRASGHTENLTS